MFLQNSKKLIYVESTKIMENWHIHTSKKTINHTLSKNNNSDHLFF